MKGIIFTEMMDFVASVWDENMVDDIIEAADLPNGGAYTSVGTYDHREAVRLLQALSDRSDISVDELLRRFGVHLAGQFKVGFPVFFDRAPTLFDLLASVDDHIHVEVLKLYPDAELPSFECLGREAHQMRMAYRSSRHMQSLAIGLIEGVAKTYGVAVAVTCTPLDDALELTVTEIAHA